MCPGPQKDEQLWRTPSSAQWPPPEAGQRRLRQHSSAPWHLSACGRLQLKEFLQHNQIAGTPQCHKHPYLPQQPSQLLRAGKESHKEPTGIGQNWLGGGLAVPPEHGGHRARQCSASGLSCWPGGAEGGPFVIRHPAGSERISPYCFLPR